MTELIEHEVLYFFDAPMLLTLRDGKDLWMAVATASLQVGAIYRAARVREAEVQACTEGQMSVRGCLAGKTSREIILKDGSYNFCGVKEEVFPEDELPARGVGLQPHMQDLPDSMPEECVDV
ncbi:MAG: hypothetical protein ABJN42_29750 [Roseibium sp.]|uniref:hypothetical protein n=1 Tax=Roseibium sp. TaxID=1936156 RepID=UPI003298A8B7